MAHHGHDAFRALDMYDTDDLRAVSRRLKRAGTYNYGDTAVAMALDAYLMGRDESCCMEQQDNGIPPLDLKMGPCGLNENPADAATRNMQDAVNHWLTQVSKRVVADGNDKLLEGLRDLGFVPRAELDAANEHAEKAERRIKELEEKLRYAESISEMMREAQEFDADAIAQDQRRIKMLEECVTANTDEINGLKRRTRELEAEVEATKANYRAMRDAWVERNDTIATLERCNHELGAQLHTLCDETRMQSSRELDRIHELERRLAQQDEDAKVGKLLCELKPGPEDYQLHLLVRVAENGSKRCRITRSIRSPKACWESGAEFDSVEKAIADYKAIADHMRKD